MTITHHATIITTIAATIAATAAAALMAQPVVLDGRHFSTNHVQICFQ